MTTRTRTAALLFGSVLALAACGANVKSGEVIDKHYEEANTYFVTECLMLPTSNGGTRCQPYQVQRYEPEHYVLTLENCSLREEGDDQCPQGEVYVDPMTYEDTEIGSNYEGDSE